MYDTYGFCLQHAIWVSVDAEVEGNSLLRCTLPGHGLVAASALQDQGVGQGTSSTAQKSFGALTNILVLKGGGRCGAELLSGSTQQA